MDLSAPGKLFVLRLRFRLRQSEHIHKRQCAGAPPGVRERFGQSSGKSKITDIDGYAGFGRFLCAPSQSGGFAVCLHWHHQMVFFSATSYFTGCRPVPLWEPSQNGGWLERPQEHYQ